MTSMLFFRWSGWVGFVIARWALGTDIVLSGSPRVNVSPLGRRLLWQILLNPDHLKDNPHVYSTFLNDVAWFFTTWCPIVQDIPSSFKCWHWRNAFAATSTLTNSALRRWSYIGPSFRFNCLQWRVAKTGTNVNLSLNSNLSKRGAMLQSNPT